MSMGRTVFASNVGGISDIIEDGKDGILYKKDDKDDFIKKIAMLSQDRKRFKNLGQAARKKVVDKFRWEESKKNLYDIYLKLG
jgi:glycosyltransferase involved in cell wall biosynthesis